MKTLTSLILGLWILIFTTPVYAVINPLSVANNKFGIHIISGSIDEASSAADLVNNNGDWGYVTFTIESKNRDQHRWQLFFNDLRARHLIPIVRLTTQTEGNSWKRPYEGEEIAWADFLDNLNWPVKNRYIIIYNEPNHALEWGGTVDASDYAKTLDKTIAALKSKNSDFFILNAGLDASAPQKLPNYQDEVSFLRDMEAAVPGILGRLDGWVSHSYPNPGFVGLPTDEGRGTVRGWLWELQILRSLGITNNLPVFITETGWKHAEGLAFDPNLPNAQELIPYYKEAFDTAWNSSRIVAVTPFLLKYTERPFDHFSILDTPIYDAIKNVNKVSGKPIQERKAELVKGEVFKSIVAGQSYNISLTFKNSGQSIWGDGSLVSLRPIMSGKELGIIPVTLPTGVKVQPGQDYTFNFPIKAPEGGSFNIVFNLFDGNTIFDSESFGFTTVVKSPVILQIKTSLKWKKKVEGAYNLLAEGTVGDSVERVYINSDGSSEQLITNYLLPDYAFDFTLEKSNYKPATIHQTVHSGINILDFGELEPDIFSVILNPAKLWKLLPFSH